MFLQVSSCSSRNPCPSDLWPTLIWMFSCLKPEQGDLQEHTMSALVLTICEAAQWGPLNNTALTGEDSKQIRLGKHCTPVADTLQCSPLSDSLRNASTQSPWTLIYKSATFSTVCFRVLQQFSHNVVKMSGSFSIKTWRQTIFFNPCLSTLTSSVGM